MSEKLRTGQKERQAKVQDIVNKLEGVDALVVNDYRGLSVSQIADIRKDLHKNNAVMHIHKNKLAKIALKEKKYPEELLGFFTGPTAITYVKGDASPVLKTLFSFVKKEYPIEVRGALVDNAIFDAAESEKLAKLPPKDQMLAILMGTMKAPIQHMVGGLNDIMSRFVRVVQLVADKKEQ